MELPFTPDQFFAVFADYNRTFWWVAVAFWVATAVVLLRAWRSPPNQSRALSFLLATLWLWNAVAYHALFFARINPAAWPFAALFAIQGVLFLRAGVRREIEYFSARRAVGVGLVAYALAYPLLSVGLAHPYPAAPTFGVPCPTAILTIGLLLTARGGAPLGLAIVPGLWGFIGGSAAVILDVPTDYVLLGAGVLLSVMVLIRTVRPPRATF